MATRSWLLPPVLFFLSACSGAASTELFDPVGQGRGTTEPIAGSADDDRSSSGGTSGTGTSSSGGSSSGGSTSSSGGSTSSGGADKDEGGTPPAAPGCVAETEPNDDDDEANLFTSCIAGALKRTDIDYAKIVAPTTARKIAIHHNEAGGNVWYRVYVDGAPLPAFDEEMPKYIPTVPGATYIVQMSPAAGGSGNRTYQLTVKFE